ncbi:MAG: PAS domain S-box protein, partial [Deltaproteobacteria bacterium]|nr:PAS domain S-box protein [Deltaproteobacteria bacterium]
MVRLLKLSIRQKLVITLLAISLLPLLVIGVWGYKKARASIEQSTYQNLSAFSHFKAEAVMLLIDTLKTRATDFASDGFVRDHLRSITESLVNPIQIDSSRLLLSAHLAKNSLALAKNLIAIDVIDHQGVVISSTIPIRSGLPLAPDIPYRHVNNEAYVAEMRSLGVDEEGFSSRQSSTLVIAVPIYSREQPIKNLGVMALYYDSRILDAVLGSGSSHSNRPNRISATGMTYVVNRDGELVTGRTLSSEDRALDKLAMPPVKEFIERNRETSGTWMNARQVLVVGASAIIELNNAKWVLITQQDHSEALRPIEQLRLLTLFVSLATILISTALALLAAKNISNPVVGLTRAADRVAAGDLSTTVDIKGDDEIAHLGEVFNKMTASLKQSQEYLKENARRLHLQSSALGAAANLIVITNSKGEIQWVNRAFVDTTGYSNEEAKGQTMRLIKSGAHDQAFYERLWTTIASGETWHSEVINRRKDGSLYYADATITPVRDEQGRIMSYVAISQDITTRKFNEVQLNEQKELLVKVNAELDQFVYTASHDLRTPLRGIASLAGFLQQDCAEQLDDNGKQLLERITKCCSQMQKLIDDLLSLSRITRIHNPFEPTDISDLMQSVLAHLEHDIRVHQAEIIIQSNLPILTADRIKLKEALINLIGNAIKFSHKTAKPHPIIEIGFVETNDNYEFFVTDNGIGIDPKHHERIFEIFKRLYSDREYEGTGAGLCIVKRVIEAHGG